MLELAAPLRKAYSGKVLPVLGCRFYRRRRAIWRASAICNKSWLTGTGPSAHALRTLAIGAVVATALPVGTGGIDD